ncbi:hypothetical protein FRC03_005059 [Tulasnella sp. 419]|nr:hypothetical protein FRC03_005059 [Tulasnella sp. 419]
MGQSQSTRARSSDRSPRNDDEPSGGVATTTPNPTAQDPKTTTTGSNSNSVQQTIVTNDTPSTSPSSTPIPRMNKGARSLRKLLNRNSWLPGSKDKLSLPKSRDDSPEPSPTGNDGNTSKAAPQQASSAKDSSNGDPSAVSAPSDTQPLLASGSGSSSQPITLTSPETTFDTHSKSEPSTSISLSDSPPPTLDQATSSTLEDASSSSVHLAVPSSPVRVPSSSSSKSKRQEQAGDHLAQERAAIRRRIATLKGSSNDQPYPTIVATSSSTPTTPTSPTSPLDSSSSESETVVHLEPDPAFIQPPFTTHSTPQVSPTRRSFNSIPSPFDIDRSFVMAEEEELLQRLVAALERSDLENRVRAVAAERAAERERAAQLLANAAAGSGFSFGGGSEIGSGTQVDPGSIASSLQNQRMRISGAHRHHHHHLHPPRSPGYGYHRNYGYGTSSSSSFSAPSTPSTAAMPTSPSSGPGTTQQGTSTSPGAQQQGVPSLPVIPAGTTMIVQGVVQTAEAPPPNYRSVYDDDDNATTSRPNRGSTFLSPPPPGRGRRNNLFPRGWLSGTPTGQEERSNNNNNTDTDTNRPEGNNAEGSGSGSGSGNGLASSLAPGADTPTGAAELLGALLIAAASATANMLLSDPPTESSSGSSTQNTATSPSSNLASTAQSLASSLTQPTPFSSTSATPSSSLAGTSTSATHRADPFAPSSTLPLSSTTRPTETAPSRLQRARPQSLVVPSSSTPIEDNDEDAEFGVVRPRPRDRTRPAAPRPRSLIGAVRERLFGSAERRDEPPRPRPLRPIHRPPPLTDIGTTSSIPDPLDTSPSGTPPTDPVEALRQRIANELRRALANRDGALGGLGSGVGPSSLPSSSSHTPSPTQASPSPAASTNGHENQAVMPSLEALLGTQAAANASTIGNSDRPLPIEGSFDRFLHDTSVDLRTTLLERMNRSRNVAVPIPIPAPVADNDASDSNNNNDNEDSSRPTSSSTGETGDSAAATASTSSQTPNPPIQMVYRSPDGIIEPRLNWWRMYRFPPRLVANTGATGTNGGLGLNSTLGGTRLGTGATSNPTSNPTSSTSTSNTPASSTLIPVIVVGIRTAPSVLVQDIAALTSAPSPAATSTSPSTSAATSSPTAPTRSRRFSRPLSALMGSGSGRNSPDNNPSGSGSSTALTSEAEAAISELMNPLSDLSRSSALGSSPTPPLSTSTPSTSRRPWQRAVNAFARSVGGNNSHSSTSRQDPESFAARIEREQAMLRQNLAELEATLERRERNLAASGRHAEDTGLAAGESQAGTAGDGVQRDRMRNYLIWVIGGYYPESHPILTSPNLLLNQFDQEDFWGLAELLGQVKPPVASKDDIERAGLEVIKTEQLKSYEEQKKVTSNTTERCLICLGDYEPEEDLRIMSCKHVFHQPCVDRWLEEGRNNCPACRSKGVDVENPSAASSSVGHDATPNAVSSSSA